VLAAHQQAVTHPVGLDDGKQVRRGTEGGPVMASALNNPVYRILVRNSSTVKNTWVVSGPSRRMTWLYVHSPIPVQMRLRQPVVAFLRHVAQELPANPAGRRGLRSWTLRKASNWAYPPCVVHEQESGPARLHVYARVPAAVLLEPPALTFLREALADLPATADLEAVLVA
jgi:hypothetical protein